MSNLSKKTFPKMRFLLDNLQSPINVGKVSRIAEVFMMDLCIYDPRNITKNVDNLKIISDFACGAWERRPPNTVEDLNEFMQKNKNGRIVSTCLSDKAMRLHGFEFCDNDVIFFGNEYDGLSDNVIANSKVQLCIEMPKCNLPKPRSNSPIDATRDYEVRRNGVPSLNVAVAAGIIGYEYYCWLERNGYYF